MQRLRPIFLWLYVVAFVFSVSFFDIRLVLIGASSLSILAVIAGFAALPKLELRFLVHLPVDETPSNESSTLTGGAEFRLSSSQKPLICKVKISHLETLGWLVVLPVACMYWIFMNRYSSAELLVPALGLFRVEALGFAGAMVLFKAFTWLQECWLLRSASVTLAGVIRTQPNRFGATAVYNFFDQNGERRGGVAKSESQDGVPDNGVLVFYLGDQPDQNMAASALRYHTLQTTLPTTPSELRSIEQAN